MKCRFILTKMYNTYSFDEYTSDDLKQLFNYESCEKLFDTKIV